MLTILRASGLLVMHAFRFCLSEYVFILPSFWRLFLQTQNSKQIKSILSPRILKKFNFILVCIISYQDSSHSCHCSCLCNEFSLWLLLGFFSFIFNSLTVTCLEVWLFLLVWFSLIAICWTSWSMGWYIYIYIYF